jgi:exocyst complex component 3
MVHRNFEKTEEMVKNFLDMNSRLQELENMLVEDSNDILGPAPNLLPIHYQINQLESFRNETMHQAKKASADSRATLNRWFERLNNVILAFDEYIMDLARNILPLVRAGRQDVVVKLIKIAEVEGKADEKVRLLPHTLCACPNSFAGSRNTPRNESEERHRC